MFSYVGISKLILLADGHCLLRPLWSLLNVRDELWLAWDVLSENRRNDQALFRLEVLQYATEGPFRRAQSLGTVGQNHVGRMKR